MVVLVQSLPEDNQNGSDVMKESESLRKKTPPKESLMNEKNSTVDVQKKTKESRNRKSKEGRKMVVPEDNQNGADGMNESESLRKKTPPKESLMNEKNSTVDVPKKTKESGRRKSKKGLTPYQGDSRACGMFKCEMCKKEWFSPNSWADCYQMCKGCKGIIYPYKQFRPEPGDGHERETPPHPQNMCQKCKDLGHSCVPKRKVVYRQDRCW